MSKQYLFSFDCFNEKFINFTRRFDKLTDLQKTFSVCDCLDFFFFQHAVRLLLDDTQTINGKLQLKNQRELNVRM